MSQVNMIWLYTLPTQRLVTGPGRAGGQLSGRGAPAGASLTMILYK